MGNCSNNRIAGDQRLQTHHRGSLRYRCATLPGCSIRRQLNGTTPSGCRVQLRGFARQVRIEGFYNGNSLLNSRISWAVGEVVVRNLERLERNVPDSALFLELCLSSSVLCLLIMLISIADLLGLILVTSIKLPPHCGLTALDSTQCLQGS